ncbi:hypothetical protein P4O66_003384 [Electrophorus voltai]|uniref:Contactin-5 n=1 Tax=Electrophorus voltai TaxID=2609070 RepID=A0AAD8YRU4_9TELE|nr:hypothetical protein P4O66_003384 [Electrophorus voltai]
MDRAKVPGSAGEPGVHYRDNSNGSFSPATPCHDHQDAVSITSLSASHGKRRSDDIMRLFGVSCYDVSLPGCGISVLRNNTLRISNSSRADEGSYTCRAENQFGSAELMTVLLVKEAMRVELIPRRVEVTVGESVVLSCKASHDPSLDVSFQWLLNNQPLDAEQDGGHLEYIQTQASTADLMIRSILLKHAGKYGCRVQTSADTVFAEAELLVRGPPGPPGVVIVEEITDTAATLSWSHGVDNHSPVSTYNVQARSPFSLGWQTVKTDPEHVTGDMESSTAVELNPWVEYEFRVVATNAIGTGDPSSPSRAVRTKEAVPSVAPANVSGGSGRRHELVISWEPVSEEFQNGEGFGYIVAFRANGTRGWKEKMVTSADSTTYKYRDETFPPLTPFEVKVGVYNNKGDGPFSQVVTVFSAEGEPREAPIEVKLSAMSSSEIKVTWKAPNPGPGRPQGYEVSYWKTSEQEEMGKKTRTVGNETAVLLSGLEGNTPYLIAVKGFNSIGQSPASSPVQATTRKNPPSHPPSNVMWIQEGNNVSLSWDPVKAMDNESDVIGYKVLLRQEGRGHSQVMRTPNSAAVLTLPEGGTYIIEVRAVSEGGEGAASSQIRVLTSSGVRAKSAQSSLHSLPSGLAWTPVLLVLMVPSAPWVSYASHPLTPGQPTPHPTQVTLDLTQPSPAGVPPHDRGGCCMHPTVHPSWRPGATALPPTSVRVLEFADNATDVGPVREESANQERAAASVKQSGQDGAG